MQLRAAHEFTYVASWRARFRVIDFHEANHTRHYIGLEFLNGSSRISEEVNFHIPGVDYIDPECTVSNRELWDGPGTKR